MPKQSTPTNSRATRAAAARQQAKRRENRRRIAIWGTAAVVVAGGAAAAVVLSTGSGSGGSTAVSAASTAGTARPPWPAPADPTSGIKKAGLVHSPMEGSAVHFHSHLDVFVDGKAVPVASQIGINDATGDMSELHTHDTSGVLHIESPNTKGHYTLGQLFTEWNVRLDATDLGGLKAGSGKTLTAYVDGKKVSGNPADIALVAHREIALVYGSPSQKVDVPSSYAFPAGE